MQPSPTRVALRHLRREADLTYTGPALEQGGTSINAPINRVVSLLDPYIKPGMKVLDYGAGKHARFADYFREKGAEVYAFDPHHSTGGTGWEPGSVVSKMPSGDKFDLAYSTYVLNVVPASIEDKIISKMNSLARKTLHVTRNRAIAADARKAIKDQKGKPFEFFMQHFVPVHPTAGAELEAGDVSPETIEEFARFGYATARGFQRIPMLETKGFSLANKEPKLYVG